MTGTSWSLVAIAAHMLQQEEREAVVGDLLESGSSARQGVAEILGLVLRRQAALWTDWRPWMAGFGLTIPNTLALMGCSVSVGLSFVQLTRNPAANVHPAVALPHAICQLFLLLACSWCGGMTAASVSRNTLWTSALLGTLPCLSCLAHFRMESLSAYSLFLFLPAAILGVRRGLRSQLISRSLAMLVALAVTVLLFPHFLDPSSRVSSLALLWPTWWVVASGSRPGRQEGAQSGGTNEQLEKTG